MKYALHAYWPPTPHRGDVPAFASQILDYCRTLAEKDSAFAKMRLPSEDYEWRDGPPRQPFIRSIVEEGCSSVLQTRGSHTPFRSVIFLASSDTVEGTVDILAGDDLFSDSARLAAILRLTVSFWNVDDARISAGRMNGDQHESLFWKRFLRPGSRIAHLQPVTPDYTTAEPLAHGTLYTWPEWEPRLHLGET